MNGRSVTILSLLGWIVAHGDGFSSPIGRRLSRGSNIINLGNERRQSVSSVVTKSSEDNHNEETSIPTSRAVKKVAVTGATGKTGKFVVEELLKRNVQVVGLVRNETKAAELFGSSSSDMLQIQECNLGDPAAIAKALDGCDATVWCATGFSDAPSNDTPPTATMSPEQSIDVMGVPAVANTMLQNHGSQQQNAYPKVVMLSR